PSPPRSTLFPYTTLFRSESDYLWRGVLEPKQGIAPMADRDQTVGYALIPAKAPKAGINGQDYVSMSGGGGRVVNPNGKFPQQARSEEHTSELQSPYDLVC